MTLMSREPMSMDGTHVLFHESVIQMRNRQYADEIRAQFGGRKLCFVIVMKGAMQFAVDLMRELGVRDPDQTKVDVVSTYLHVSRYGDKYHGAKVKIITPMPKRDLSLLADRVVIILEDIIDTGDTARFMKRYVARKKRDVCRQLGMPFDPNAPDVHFLALTARKKTQETNPIPNLYPPLLVDSDEWLIGYGLGRDEQDRHLHRIYTIPRPAD